MTFQDEVGWITLAGIGCVALVFLYVISQATGQAEAAQVQARPTPSGVGPFWGSSCWALG
jgi:hypothetical protein